MPLFIRILFYIFIIFLPHTNLSVPVALDYEFTLADLCLFILAPILILFVRKVKKEYEPYLIGFLFFIFTLLMSFVNARSTKLFVSDLIPYIFSFLVLITCLIFFSNISSNVNSLKNIFKILFITFLLTNIPVYYQIITGIKPLSFYDPDGWRYTFLCQNPNQFGVYIILYSFLIVILSVKYFKQYINYVGFSLLLFIPTALYSGSKTVALIFALNLVIFSFIFFSNTPWRIRLTILPIALVYISFNIVEWAEKITETTGQAERALQIFDQLSKRKSDQEVVGGDSGASMDEALRLFKNYPLTGVGLANKPMYSPVVTEIHNTYLKVLAESGIIGFIGFITIFLLPIIYMFRAHQSLQLKVYSLIFYLLFASMNWPHMLFRQRWVWFFMVMIFIISQIDANRNNINNNTNIA